MSFNQQPQAKQQTNRSDQATSPSAYVVAQRERTYQRWLRPLLGEPSWPISEIGRGFPDRHLWPSDWAGLANRLRPCHSWAEVLAQLKAWFLTQPERLLRLLAALRPGQALRRLSLSQLVALALSAGLTAGMVGQPLLALAQGSVPVGDEFRVNSYTTNGQRKPNLAMDTEGNFVIVWESYNQDNSSYGIYGQRYNANGIPQGSEFQINSYTTNFQSNPSVAVDTDGDFVVVWNSYNQDGSHSGIYGQRYNANGVPQGSEFQINSYTSGRQDNPSVAIDADGNFVVAWQDASGQDGSNSGVYARQYNAGGLPQSDEFLVNTYTTYNQRSPSVAMDADGDFTIVWSSGDYFFEFGGGTQDGSGTGVFAQRYNASGIPQGSEFQVNSYTPGSQGNPSVAMDAAGNFVITWTNPYDISAQRYNANGVPQGSEFRVNTYTTYNQIASSVAMDADGNFVVVWQSGDFTGQGQDGSGFGIYSQQFNKNGDPRGNEFQINTYTTGEQINPEIAMDADGDFVVAWRSDGQDGDGGGIYAQRYSRAKTVYLPLVLKK